MSKSSFLIHLDQTASQNMFKPGGFVRVIPNSSKMVTGFLFRWQPGSIDFEIITPTGGIRRFEYFQCREIWYTPCGPTLTDRVRDVVAAIEAGKKKVRRVSPEHTQQLRNLVKAINALPPVEL